MNWRVAAGILTLGLAVFASCQGPCTSRRLPKPAAPNGIASTVSTFSQEPVSYCRERRAALSPVRVQLLLDASGSMNGLTGAMPAVVDWIEHAVSGLRGTSIELSSARTCQFSQRMGVAECVSGITLQNYHPQSDTNLHRAIRSAAVDADLTFVITDGVAATGVGGDADCASGVDAACVARALSATVEPAVSDSESGAAFAAPAGDPGIWLLPLLAPFAGTFYTEEPIRLEDFDADATIAGIRTEIERETKIQGMRVGRDGRLNFYYEGPKALLLVIIARRQDLGRDAIASLANQTKLRGVKSAREIKDFAGGIASLPAIEVYPGFLNPVRFDKLEPVDEHGEHKGPLDVAYEAGQQRGTVRLDCPPSRPSRGAFLLHPQKRGGSQSGSCVPILQLSAFSLRLEPYRTSDQGSLDRLLSGYRLTEGDALRLELACGYGEPRPCSKAPVLTRWVAVRDYARPAAALADGEGGSPALENVLALSTSRPSLEPHRIFGLAPALQAFYDLTAAKGTRSLTLADFQICNGAGQ